MQKSAGGKKESRTGRSARLQRSEYLGLRLALTEAIQRKGLTQRQLSRDLGMRVSYVNKILMGSRTVDIVELVDLARKLDMDPVEFFERAIKHEP